MRRQKMIVEHGGALEVTATPSDKNADGTAIYGAIVLGARPRWP
jgi:hypothetical protein